MPNPSNALAQARLLIGTRLRELDQERTRLEQALSSLGGAPSRGRPRGRPAGSSANGRRSGPGRPPGSGKRTRRKRSGGRRDQALAAIKANPGITVSEIAAELKIAPNYVYRLIADLKKDRKVKKQGKGLTAN